MKKLLIALCVALLMVGHIACQSTDKSSSVTATATTTVKVVDDNLPEIGLPPVWTAKQNMKYLTADELGGRQSGTPGGKLAADYISGQFKALGLESFSVENRYLQPFTVQGKNMQNVVGYLPGSDEKLKEEAIIIGAHFDHLGLDDKGGIRRGADDNASGVVALLDLAKQYTQSSRKSLRTVIFIAFDGEEIGLLGSGYYTKNQLWPADKTVFMLNLDTIGRPVNKKLYISGSASSPALKETLNMINEARGFGFELVYNEVPGGGDHISFLLAKMPAYFFFTGGHVDYHKVTDTADKIDFTGLEQVTLLAKSFSAAVANLPVKPAFTDVPITMMPAAKKKRSSLGVMPDFSGSDKGFLVGGVGKDSPAAKAGLQKGDIILTLGETSIKDLKDLAQFLNSHQPGEVVKIVYLRGEQKLEGEATLRERMMR